MAAPSYASSSAARTGLLPPSHPLAAGTSMRPRDQSAHASVTEIKPRLRGLQALLHIEERESRRQAAAAGFTASEAHEAGYKPQQLREGYKVREMRAAGWTLQQAKDAGFSDRAFEAAGYETMGEVLDWDHAHRVWAGEQWVGQNDGYCLNKNNCF